MPLCPQLPKTASNKQADSGEEDQVSPSLTTAMLSDDSVSPNIERSLCKFMSRLVGELFECRQLKKMGMVRWRCDRQSLTRVAELRGGTMKGEKCLGLERDCLILERTKYVPSVGAELLKQKSLISYAAVWNSHCPFVRPQSSKDESQQLPAPCSIMTS